VIKHFSLFPLELVFFGVQNLFCLLEFVIFLRSKFILLEFVLQNKFCTPSCKLKFHCDLLLKKKEAR